MPPRMPNTDWMNSGGVKQTAIEEMRGRVEMADVVALELEARAVLAARGEDVGDVLEGVLEDAVVAAREVGPLPVVLPRFGSRGIIS